MIDDLISTVDTLNARMGLHSDALKKNEAMTRYALVDPLLRALGWDTGDPAMVVPEYSAGKGKADYALMHGSQAKPALIIEAKSLDTPLGGSTQQGVLYCTDQGIEHLALTDGRRWRIYDAFQRVPMAEKLVVQFDLQESGGRG